MVTMLKTTYKECETLYKNWVAKHALPMEAVVVTINDFVGVAAVSLVMDALFLYACTTFSVYPPQLASLNHSKQLAKVSIYVVMHVDDIHSFDFCFDYSLRPKKCVHLIIYIYPKISVQFLNMDSYYDWFSYFTLLIKTYIN